MSNPFRRVSFTLAFLAMLFLPACGGGPATDLTPQPAAGGAAAGVEAESGAEILGTVSNHDPSSNLLVFAYADMPPSQSPVTAEPIDIASVAADGSFLLDDLPAGRVTIVFLHDKANDGVIDVDDPFAVLEDPEARLQPLRDGDHVTIANVSIDTRARQARPESISVRSRDAQSETAAITPEDSPAADD
jgi:hypothetical protein